MSSVISAVHDCSTRARALCPRPPLRPRSRTQQFLLVGQALEPRVALSRTHLNFQARLVGRSATDTVVLTNPEPIPFAFSFDLAALQQQLDQIRALQADSPSAGVADSSAALAAAPVAPGRSPARARTGASDASEADGASPAPPETPVVVIIPAQGTVAPGGEVPIQVRFTPAAEAAYNLNVTCAIRTKTARLRLNIKGEGYRVHEALQLEPLEEPAVASAGQASPRAPTNPPRPIPLRPFTGAPAGSGAAAALAVAASKAAAAGPPGPRAAATLATATGGEGAPAPEVLGGALLIPLDFGTVQIQEQRQRRVTITNTGTFPLEFAWTVGPAPSLAPQPGSDLGAVARTSRAALHAAQAATRGAVSVVPAVGTVAKGERVTCAITFRPTAPCVIDGLPLWCRITNGPQYSFVASGRGYRPHLEFSFTEHDFGPCFLQPPPLPLAAAPAASGPQGGSAPPDNASSPAAAAAAAADAATMRPPPTVVLTISNNDTRDISYEPLFVGEGGGCLASDAAPTLLAPGQSRQTTFRFLPREHKPYVFKLPFLVNGLVAVDVTVRGEGIPVRLELAPDAPVTTVPLPPGVVGPGPVGPVTVAPCPPGCELADLEAVLARRVSFGGLRIGQEAVRIVPLVNRSKIPLVFTFAPSVAAMRNVFVRIVPPPTHAAAAAGPTATNPHALARNSSVLSAGAATFTLQPRETLALSLAFAPQARLQAFLLPIVATCAGFRRPLFALHGACLGLDVKPDATTVPFGAVTRGSRVVRRIRIDNTGDLTAYLHWDVAALGPDFSLSPATAMLRPGAEAVVCRLHCTVFLRNVTDSLGWVSWP